MRRRPFGFLIHVAENRLRAAHASSVRGPFCRGRVEKRTRRTGAADAPAREPCDSVLNTRGRPRPESAEMEKTRPGSAATDRARRRVRLLCVGCTHTRADRRLYLCCRYHLVCGP